MLRLGPLRHCMGTAWRVGPSIYFLALFLPGYFWLAMPLGGGSLLLSQQLLSRTSCLGFLVSCWLPSIRPKDNKSCALVSGLLFFVFVFFPRFLLCIIPMLSLHPAHIFVNYPFYKPFLNYRQFECSICFLLIT